MTAAINLWKSFVKRFFPKHRNHLRVTPGGKKLGEQSRCGQTDHTGKMFSMERWLPVFGYFSKWKKTVLTQTTQNQFCSNCKLVKFYTWFCKTWIVKLGTVEPFFSQYQELNSHFVCVKYGSFELLQEEINFHTLGHTFWTKLESSFTLKKWCLGASIFRERTSHRFDQYYTLRKACGPLTIHRYKYELEGGA